MRKEYDAMRVRSLGAVALLLSIQFAVPAMGAVPWLSTLKVIFSEAAQAAGDAGKDFIKDVFKEKLNDWLVKNRGEQAKDAVQGGDLKESGKGQVREWTVKPGVLSSAELGELIAFLKGAEQREQAIVPQGGTTIYSTSKVENSSNVRVIQGVNGNVTIYEAPSPSSSADKSLVAEQRLARLNQLNEDAHALRVEIGDLERRQLELDQVIAYARENEATRSRQFNDLVNRRDALLRAGDTEAAKSLTAQIRQWRLGPRPPGFKDIRELEAEKADVAAQLETKRNRLANIDAQKSVLVD